MISKRPVNFGIVGDHIMPRLISMTDHLSFKTVLMLLVGARHDKPGGARHRLIVWRMHSMTVEKLVIRG